MAYLKTQRDVPWIDALKGMAMIGVIFEHWNSIVPHQSSIHFLERFASLTSHGGLLVHQFFLLSGFGLAFSYFRRGVPSWIDWTARRFVKVVIPYWAIITATFLILVSLHQLAPERHSEEFTGGTLLAYLTFTRNFFPSSWSLNHSFWFIPVIVGLYACFPLLIRFLDRHGPGRFLLLAIGLTLGSLALFLPLGYSSSHQAAIFPFFIITFGAGMLMAHAICRRSFRLERLIRWPFCLAGIGLVGISAVLVRTLSWGGAVNDLFTAIGLFLVLIYVVDLLHRFRLTSFSRFFAHFGRYSYTIYLIHWPLMKFGAGPSLQGSGGKPLDSALFLAVELVSIPVLLLIAMAVEKPVAALTTSVGRRMTRAEV